MEEKELDGAQYRHYALEKLADAKRSILSGNRAMLVCRAKAGRMPDKASVEETYIELRRIRSRLVQSLCDARLALLEIEEYQGTKIAARLSQGLSGFDLESTEYKPVYEALQGFAAKLPDVSEQKVSAAVIGRLMNSIKMGYYPTDPVNIRHILKGVRFPDGITANLFDPCCGCGKALRQLADGNNCYAYGMELDEYRAEEAQSRLHRVGLGSFFHSRISNGAFHAILLNPPYLSVLNQSGGKVRQEKRFLADSLPHLMEGGLMIYIIPYYRLTEDVCRILCDNLFDVSIWRFTDSEFKRFKQVAVLGLRKSREDGSAPAEELARLALEPENIPCITQLAEDRYGLPAVAKAVDVFKGEKFNEKELERQLLRSDSFQRLMAGSELDSSDKRPLLPLSIGQVGLIGGSGMINGLIDCGTPHIIKGRIVKVRKSDTEEKFNSRGAYTGSKIKEVISNKMIFNLMTAQGFKALT